MNAIYPDPESKFALKLAKYERVQLLKFSKAILKDSGIPDIMKIIVEVTNRMKKLKSQNTE